MECERCGEEFSSERERIDHVLEEHDDELTSHERDELKRERNQIEGGEDSRFPVRTLGLAGLVLAVLLGGGYLLVTTGTVSFSAGSSTPTGAAVGPTGSTHVHAAFSVVVNGDRIDFSRDMYQMQSNKVHFEAGNGRRIHVHATGVTIGYALQTLGLGINSTCLEVQGEEYCEAGGSELEVSVDGAKIKDAAEHVIRDGENIRITYSG